MSESKSPKQVLIIRHGEKSGDPGVDNTGDGPSLSTRGYERAGALAPYVPAQFGRPDFLFATRASENSNRPVETITPLSKAIGVPIDDKHADKDYGKVASDILGNPKYAGKLVLICWHHGKIPELATALRGAAGIQMARHRVRSCVADRLSGRRIGSQQSAACEPAAKAAVRR